MTNSSNLCLYQDFSLFLYNKRQFICCMTKITVQDTDISIVKYNEEDYISLTDMARSQMQEHIIFRWLSLKSTIEYLGEWEMLYNPVFNCTEFGTIKIGIIQHFPFAKILDSAFKTKPTEDICSCSWLLAMSVRLI